MENIIQLKDRLKTLENNINIEIDNYDKLEQKQEMLYKKLQLLYIKEQQTKILIEKLKKQFNDD